MKKVMLTVCLFVFGISAMAAVAEIFTGSLPVKGNGVDWWFAFGALFIAAIAGFGAMKFKQPKPKTSV